MTPFRAASGPTMEADLYHKSAKAGSPSTLKGKKLGQESTWLRQ